MRRLLLPLALLLGPPGLAQDLTTPVPAEPPATPAPTILRLAPKPGTLLEFAQTVRQTFDVREAQLEPRPGQTLGPKLKAEFERNRADLLRSFKTAAQAAAGASKTFVKVLPSLPDGRQVIVYNTIIPDPRTGQSHSLRFRQTVAPDGQSRFEVDGPVDPLYQPLAEGLRTGLLDQSNQLTGSLYNRPLMLDEPFEQRVTIDFQKFFGSLFAGLGVGASSVPTSRPTQISYTSTYRGPDAAGLHLFDTTGQTDPVAVKVELRGVSLDLRIQTMSGRGQTLVRPDGLLGGLTSHNEGEFEMVVAMQAEQSQIRLKGRIIQDQTQTLRAAAEGP